MNLLYVSDCYTGSTIFYSQVHTLCNYHAGHCTVKLLCLCKPDELAADIVAGADYELHKVRRLPLAFIPESTSLNAYVDSRRELFAWADVVHCRGPIAAAYAIKALRVNRLDRPVIADIRGVMAEEIAQSKSRLRGIAAKAARRTENYVFANADYFFMVSENMKKHYTAIYPAIADRTTVFPTIVDERYFRKSAEIRQVMRDELGLAERTVYLYSGGVARWQNIGEILKGFVKTQKVQPKAFLIMLVRSVDYVKMLMDELDIDGANILVRGVPYEKVADYLNAADYGIIIRDNSIVNWVASPTKVNEYLACGLQFVTEVIEAGFVVDADRWPTKYMPLTEIISQQQTIYRELVGNLTVTAREKRCF